MNELENIRSFIAAVETGNLAHAAQRVHITKSVLSRRISNLEAALGTQLFTRSTKGLTVTDVGRRYYDHVTRIVAELDDAKQALKDDDQKMVGTIRLTAPEAYSRKFLYPLFLQVMQENPDLRLETSFADRMIDIAAEGYDLALRIGTSTQTSLIGRKVADIPTILVAAPDYLEKHGTPQHPDDLRDHRCITYTNTTNPHQWHFQQGSKKTTIKVNSILQSDSGDLMAEAAFSGLGILSTPRFFVSEALETGSLISLLEPYKTNDRSLYVLYPDRRHQKQSVRLLINQLIKHCQNTA